MGKVYASNVKNGITILITTWYAVLLQFATSDFPW